MQIEGTSRVDWAVSNPVDGMTPESVFFGHGSPAQALQVAVARSSVVPNRTTMKALYADRKGKHAIKLVVAAIHGDSVSIFGPDPDAEILTLKVASGYNYLNACLAEPDGLLGYQRAIGLRRSLQTTDIAGFTNNGLFASHYVRSSAGSHRLWPQMVEQAKSLVHLRHQKLIDGLGFEVTGKPGNTLLLKAKNAEKRVVAIILEHQTEQFDAKSNRFQASPVEWGLAMAASEGAPWLIAIRDAQIRLYPARDGVGVGHKSQVETYFEIDLLTIDEEKSGLLPLIFSAEALTPGGTADELLENSQKFAAELGGRLRERVYESVVPNLATEVARQLQKKGLQLDSRGLHKSYEITLRILFRLLFQAYAEDRGLLPAGRNERFDKNSMKDRAKDFLKQGPDHQFGESASIWLDLMQVWDAIDLGNPDMQIPAYNGGLFGSDEQLHPEGFLIRGLSIPDTVMGPALRALVIDEVTEDGVPGAVDFRSLSVREFGTIYEGLLESSLSVAEQDLTVDKKNAWVPASDGDEILAKAGEVYFHSASGERKATGSYYTPSFVVDHLIERSIEPALRAHLEKVRALIDADDQAGAYALFFDFRVADLAMGSGHFLVAAIDKIESIMRSFLLEDGVRIDGVEAELMRLAQAAKEALGDDEAAYAEIERAALLRRQIARRCIYGIDINSMAVELSRLAIWIHTFVPGLPMSSLEHGLVCGNSLTGIGTIDEGLNALLPDRVKTGTSLFDGVIEDSLASAKTLLENVASADEATKKEAKRAAEVAQEAKLAAAASKLIFDLAVASRMGIISTAGAMTQSELEDLGTNQEVVDLINSLAPAHMPFLFPEVFLRDNPGFDVLIGNPPWEELVIDTTRFWAAKMPGFLSLPMQERNRRIQEFELSRPADYSDLQTRTSSLAEARAVLMARFPLGTGDLDLYKAFGWVCRDLVRNSGGFIALVLPKTAFSAAGMEGWRRALQDKGSLTSLTYLVNSNQWVFAIHPQYSVALMVFESSAKCDLAFAGPIYDYQSFKSLSTSDFVAVERDLLLSFTESGSIPAFGDKATAEVMVQMRRQPSLSEFAGGTFKPVREFDATLDKEYFDHGDSQTEPRLPVLSGKSFNVWQNWTGELFAHANPSITEPELSRRLERQLRLKTSAFFGWNFENDLGSKHPLHRPRIAFRGVTNPTNSRTLIPALIRPMCVLTNIAPYLTSKRGFERQEAFLLGVLSSLVFDWYARKFIETAVNFHLLNAFPVPAYEATPAQKRIVELSAKLAATSSDYESWANEIGVRVGALKSEPHRQHAIYELDALVALEFGLSRSQLTHIFETFHRGWDHRDRLESVLSFFEEKKVSG